MEIAPANFPRDAGHMEFGTTAGRTQHKWADSKEAYDHDSV